MKESHKFNIAASISAVTSAFVGMLSLRKLPDFDKDVDYRKILTSKDDAANIAGKWALSFGVDMICVALTSAVAMISFLGSKLALDRLFPTKEEEKDPIPSRPMLNEKEVREIREHWQEKDSGRAWQEKLDSETSIPSPAEKGFKA
jgi:hypothetical protein